MHITGLAQPFSGWEAKYFELQYITKQILLFSYINDPKNLLPSRNVMNSSAISDKLRVSVMPVYC